MSLMTRIGLLLIPYFCYANPYYVLLQLNSSNCWTECTAIALEKKKKNYESGNIQQIFLDSELIGCNILI